MGPEAAVNAVYHNKLAALPEAERPAETERLQREYREDVDLVRLAADLVVDAVVDPEDLRAELARRLAFAAGKQRDFTERRHGVPPV
jgi:acetyl-CoA carboxylase carboxyltransferase component